MNSPVKPNVHLITTVVSDRYLTYVRVCLCFLSIAQYLLEQQMHVEYFFSLFFFSYLLSKKTAFV